jgi:hypothetical protein
MRLPGIAWATTSVHLIRWRRDTESQVLLPVLHPSGRQVKQPVRSSRGSLLHPQPLLYRTMRFAGAG